MSSCGPRQVENPQPAPVKAKLTCLFCLFASSSEDGSGPQDGPGPANPLSHRLKLLSYSATCWLNNKDSLNGCQIAAKPVPLETHTYTVVVAWKRPTTSPANKHQLPPVPSPERVLQLASSGDMVNNSGKTKHCHFCPPEPAQPRPLKLVPLRAQTYTEVVAWKRPTTSPANKHQLPPVPSPERGMQLSCSGDIVNHSSKIKHCHFFLPERTQPGPDALQTLSQDLCPSRKPPMDLKPAKSKEAESHVIFYLNSNQVDHQATTPSGDQPDDPTQALYRPPGASFRPVHFTNYLPNLAYAEYNLKTILIDDPLARTRETEYIGREGKWYIRLPRLFKDKYNYLPAYFVPMTLPLTPRPDRSMEPTAAAESTSTQLFGVLHITLTGLVDSMVPNSRPWSLLGQSASYNIKLAPILWWALPAGLAAPHPELPNALPTNGFLTLLAKYSIWTFCYCPLGLC
ncbi:hypothetical protein DSO57_1026830 [Entomophthora muscae]|uniref:Uncharacterized protein n=1 Tax=Entomophthora muscae TaxID=34485 RepID=A0ACC2RGT7_9FUNG|nr:hypothetical protein DSO57_1026830 [Entomophthora muscae]